MPPQQWFPICARWQWSGLATLVTHSTSGSDILFIYFYLLFKTLTLKICVFYGDNEVRDECY